MNIAIVNVDPSIGQEKIPIGRGFIVDGKIFFFPGETPMLREIKKKISLLQKAGLDVNIHFPKTKDEIATITPITRRISPLEPLEIEGLREELVC